MFDVFWTDHDKKFVGEHRARKADERRADGQSQSQSQQSTSSASSASASARTGRYTTGSTSASAADAFAPTGRYATAVALTRRLAPGSTSGHTRSAASSGSAPGRNATELTTPNARGPITPISAPARAVFNPRATRTPTATNCNNRPGARDSGESLAASSGQDSSGRRAGRRTINFLTSLFSRNRRGQNNTEQTQDDQDEPPRHMVQGLLAGGPAGGPAQPLAQGYPQPQPQGLPLTEENMSAVSLSSIAATVDTCDIAMIMSDSSDSASVYSTPDSETVEHPSPTSPIVNTRVGRDLAPSGHLRLRDMGETSGHNAPRTPRPLSMLPADEDSPVELIPGLRIRRRLNEDMPNNPAAWDARPDMPDMASINVDQLLDDELLSLRRQRQTSLEVDRSRTFARDVAYSVGLIRRDPEIAFERLVVIDANLPILGQGVLNDEVLKERALLLAAAVHHHKPFMFVDWPEDEDEDDDKPLDKGKGKEVDDEPKRLLTLYETPTTSSYLAIHYRDMLVHHMSREPLENPAEYPSIHAVVVPEETEAFIPFSANTFDAIHSSLFARHYKATEYPAVLQNASLVLKPDGIFYVTIVDPLPFSGNCGPLMEEWLRSHLLVNLVRQGLSTKPSTHFINQAADTNLAVSRGQEVLWFPALLGVDFERVDQDPFIDAEYMSRQAEDHLACVVGREVWRALWEDFVTLDGGRWWWDVPKIVQECKEWKTHWLYHSFKCTHGDYDN